MGEKVERERQIELFSAEPFSFQAGFQMVLVSMAGFKIVFPSMVKSPIQLDSSLESSSNRAPSSGTKFGLPRLCA